MHFDSLFKTFTSTGCQSALSLKGTVPLEIYFVNVQNGRTPIFDSFAYPESVQGVAQQLQTHIVNNNNILC